MDTKILNNGRKHGILFHIAGENEPLWYSRRCVIEDRVMQKEWGKLKKKKEDDQRMIKEYSKNGQVRLNVKIELQWNI